MIESRRLRQEVRFPVYYHATSITMAKKVMVLSLISAPVAVN